MFSSSIIIGKNLLSSLSTCLKGIINHLLIFPKWEIRRKMFPLTMKLTHFSYKHGQLSWQTFSEGWHGLHLQNTPRVNHLSTCGVRGGQRFFWYQVQPQKSRSQQGLFLGSADPACHKCGLTLYPATCFPQSQLPESRKRTVMKAAKYRQGCLRHLVANTENETPRAASWIYSWTCAESTSKALLKED